MDLKYLSTYVEDPYDHPRSREMVCCLTDTVMFLPIRHARIGAHKSRHADGSFQYSLSHLQPVDPIETPTAWPKTSSTPISNTLNIPPAMRLPIFAALLGFLAGSLAHNIQMGAHQRECFHEVLHKDDKMTVTFQVGDREFGGAGNLEIDFWVSASPWRVLQAKWIPHHRGQRLAKAPRGSTNISYLTTFMSYSLFRALPVMVADTLLCFV